MLYGFVESWLNNADKVSVTEYKKKFVILHKEEFGDITNRLTNPLARQYEAIASALVRYSQTKDKKDLELAKNKFSMVLKTYG